jgi:hypothetical protein
LPIRFIFPYARLAGTKSRNCLIAETKGYGAGATQIRPEIIRADLCFVEGKSTVI